jgi:hypothetical protein
MDASSCLAAPDQLKVYGNRAPELTPKFTFVRETGRPN